jgi:hypothetical protein
MTSKWDKTGRWDSSGTENGTRKCPVFQAQTRFCPTVPFFYRDRYVKGEKRDWMRLFNNHPSMYLCPLVSVGQWDKTSYPVWYQGFVLSHPLLLLGDVSHGFMGQAAASDVLDPSHPILEQR